jgi:hypothetical protein
MVNPRRECWQPVVGNWWVRSTGKSLDLQLASEMGLSRGTEPSACGIWYSFGRLCQNYIVGYLFDVCRELGAEVELLVWRQKCYVCIQQEHSSSLPYCRVVDFCLCPALLAAFKGALICPLHHSLSLGPAVYPLLPLMLTQAHCLLQALPGAGQFQPPVLLFHMPKVH